MNQDRAIAKWPQITPRNSHVAQEQPFERGKFLFETRSVHFEVERATTHSQENLYILPLRNKDMFAYLRRLIGIPAVGPQGR